MCCQFKREIKSRLVSFMSNDIFVVRLRIINEQDYPTAQSNYTHHDHKLVNRFYFNTFTVTTREKTLFTRF